MAEKGNLVALKDRSDSAAFSTPEDVLEDVSKLLKDKEKGAFVNGKKILVLMLDDTDDHFTVSFVQGGMKMSECLAVAEVAKSIFKSYMHYSVLPE